MVDYVIVTDGSAYGTTCGCAGAIVNTSSQRFFTFNEYIGHESNSYAEVYAVKRSLEILKKECVSKKNVEILIVSDSASVINFINGRMTPKAYKEVYEYIESIMKRKKYTIRGIHIPAHKTFQTVKGHFVQNGIKMDDKTIRTLVMLHQRMDTEARAAVNREILTQIMGSLHKPQKNKKKKKSKKTAKGEAPRWMVDLFSGRLS